MALHRSVREAPPQARLLQPAQRLARMLRGTYVVAPVMNESDAREHGLGAGQARAVIHVGGLVHPADAERGREVAVLLLGTRHAAQDRVPHVPVGLDQPRQHDHAARVEHLGTWRLQPAAHRDDRAVAHMDVGAGQVAGLAVHRHHMAAAHQPFTARGQATAARRGRGAACHRQRAQRGSATKQAAARNGGLKVGAGRTVSFGVHAAPPG